MKVARHEMPGTCPKGDPSRRDGVIVIPGLSTAFRSQDAVEAPIIPSRWGLSDFAAKRLKIIAQGFSPGSGVWP